MSISGKQQVSTYKYRKNQFSSPDAIALLLLNKLGIDVNKKGSIAAPCLFRIL